MNSVSTPTPALVAFLVCDSVIQDGPSGKKTLVGVFSNILVENFPAAHASPWLFVKLIDCEGSYDVKFEFVRVSGQEILLEANGNLNATDRHSNTEFALQLPQLPIPAAGQYEFRLWMNEKFISNVRIDVDVQESR